MTCCKAFLGVCFPYLGAFIDHKCGSEYWINFLFCFCCGPVAILHYFAINEVDLLTNLLSLSMPPFAVYLMRKDYGSVVINIILCSLFFFPGVIHAYFIALTEHSKVNPV